MSISNFKILGSVPVAASNDQTRARSATSGKPILHVQAGDTFEIRGIGGYDCGTCCISVGGNQQVVAPDWLSGRFQHRADSVVFGVSRNIKWQHVNFGEQVFDGLEQSFRTALRASVAQFGRHNNARADVVFAQFHNLPCCSASRIPDQVGNDVRIQRVAGQSMLSAGGTGSSISGKSTSRGFIVLSKAMRPRLRTGSITRRSPSRWMIASSAGNSNSANTD